MEFTPTAISGAFVIGLHVQGDPRGRFSRTYCEREFAEAGLQTRWVQANHSVTLGRGSARGLHYQVPPHGEAKLISCVFGRAFDVAVDLRRSSPTFLKWASIELDQSTSLYLPPGCAHGFQALEDEVHLTYLHSQFYEPDAERGLRLDDPRLAIDWPLPLGERSQRDRDFPLIGADFAGVD